jgi:hypothetical protein
MLIVLPGSPSPVMVVPFVGFTIGADGLLVAALLTTVVTAGDGALPGSVCVAETVVGAGSELAKVQVQIPLGGTTIGVFVQVAPVTVIVAPGVPLPLITLSFELIGLMVGELEVVAGSVTVDVAGGDTFPVGSV